MRLSVLNQLLHFITPSNRVCIPQIRLNKPIIILQTHHRTYLIPYLIHIVLRGAHIGQAGENLDFMGFFVDIRKWIDWSRLVLEYFVEVFEDFTH